MVGHVEHITLGRVPALPGPGDIAHLEEVTLFPGGGGGVAFHQLARSPAEVHLFTAFGDDEAGAWVEARVSATGAAIHGARRRAPHTRDLVMITPEGERTIVVVGQPLHPEATDPLPWELLGQMDAVYFTAQDPELLRLGRQARQLVATARRRLSLIASGVAADVVLGSRADPRERCTLADFPVSPTALVMTEGPAGGVVERASGSQRFSAPRVAQVVGGAYGAGDSFAGALTYHLARGLDVAEAATRAAHHGAAVLAGLDPLAVQRPRE